MGKFKFSIVIFLIISFLTFAEELKGRFIATAIDSIDLFLFITKINNATWWG